MCTVYIVKQEEILPYFTGFMIGPRILRMLFYSDLIANSGAVGSLSDYAIWLVSFIIVSDDIHPGDSGFKLNIAVSVQVKA